MYRVLGSNVMPRWLGMSLLFTASLQCGGSTTDEVETASDPPVSVEPDDSETGAVGEGEDAGGRAQECPARAPTDGDTCSGIPLCSYGEELRSDCRRTFGCEGDVWRDLSGACEPIPESQCPKSMPTGVCDPVAADGEALSAREIGSGCLYEGAHCTCPRCTEATCGGSLERMWSCTPLGGEGCPERIPNFGEGCSDQGLECRYGDPCTTGLVVVCFAGAWSFTRFGCAE